MSFGARRGGDVVPHARRWLLGICGAIGLLFVVASLATAKDVRIATWNVEAAFSPDKIPPRAEKFRAMNDAVKPDVLLVQEIGSAEVLAALRDALGLKDYYIACSDFNQNDHGEYEALEVGIISRYPLSQVIEYDPTPDNVPSEGDPQELALEPLLKLGMKKPQGDGRGFLWARIDDLELTVVVVHLKSSRGVDGVEDVENAKRREFVVAGVAASVLEDQRTWPNYTCLVGGDFNVGHSDKMKNGHNLAIDSTDPNSGQDLYDDTHALLADGLVGGLRMKNLVLHHMDPTFPEFPSTPIDNLYVVGKHASDFTPAEVSQETYGSDHRPVVTVLSSSTAPANDQVVASGPFDPPTKPAADEPQPVLLAKADSEPKRITPAEAKDHVGETCEVEMTVQASRLLKDKNTCLLNSEVDHHNDKNFTVVIFETGLKSFANADIDDPAAHFLHKKILVTGKIGERNKQYQIIVSDRSQIEKKD